MGQCLESKDTEMMGEQSRSMIGEQCQERRVGEAVLRKQFWESSNAGTMVVKGYQCQESMDVEEVAGRRAVMGSCEQR